MTRRRLFVLAALCAAVLLIVVTVYAALPWMLACLVSSRMPIALGPAASLTAIATAAEPPSTPASIDVVIAPGLARRWIHQRTGRWIPPWLLRDDQQADGQFTPPGSLEASTWRVRLGGQGATVAIDRVLVAPLLAKASERPVSLLGLPCRWQATLTTARATTSRHPSDGHRLHIDASGGLVLTSALVRLDLPIERLEAEAAITDGKVATLTITGLACGQPAPPGLAETIADGLRVAIDEALKTLAMPLPDDPVRVTLRP